jgi:hypothetical protein
MIYEDLPLSYDAWDAEVYHLDMGREVIFEEVEVFNGPLRSALRCTARFGKSRVVLVVSEILELRMAFAEWSRSDLHGRRLPRSQ